MRLLFTTLQTYETDFYGRVGAELERRGHETAHVSVSREAARLLREQGLESRCLLDAVDEPASYDDEVRRIEATYPIPHIRDVYYADKAAAALSRRRRSAAPSATSGRSSGSWTSSAPTCSCPRSGTRRSASSPT